ncbi:MAG: cell division protein FtsH, partial [Ignavibacteriaceae bacterium]|nr:cell division protein FtsH [Ignavibacteriaceae bacterium]
MDNNNPKGQKQNNNQNRPDDNFDWSKVMRMVFAWGFVIIAAVVAMQLFRGDTGNFVEITLPEYKRLLDTNAIESATVKVTDGKNYFFQGKIRAGERVYVNNEPKDNIENVSVYIPEPEITEQSKIWESKGLKYTYEQQSNEWLNILLSMIPWILIIAVWFFFMKRMQGGAGGGSRGIFNFGKSRAKMINQSTNKVTFKDVAGADEAKVELQEIIEFLREPSKFHRLG